MQINVQLKDLLLTLAILGYFFVPWREGESRAASAEPRTIQRTGAWVGGPLREAVPMEHVKGDEAAMLARKEEILRSHLQALAAEWETVERERAALRRALLQASAHGNAEYRAALAKELRLLEQRYDEVDEARARLLALERDRTQYERELRASYEAVASSQPRFFTPRLMKRETAGTHTLSWPVPPFEGISAGYLDASYRKRFGMDHSGVDIPVAQGTEIQAPADGIVAAVHDRGYGYSTVLLEHGNGLQTLFGHVSEIRVREGQRVSRGEIIALSGGRPGSQGAGLLTTGPHVHFEVHAYGQPIDPLYRLSPLREAIASAKESVMPAM